MDNPALNIILECYFSSHCRVEYIRAHIGKILFCKDHKEMTMEFELPSSSYYIPLPPCFRIDGWYLNQIVIAVVMGHSLSFKNSEFKTCFSLPHSFSPSTLPQFTLPLSFHSSRLLSPFFPPFLYLFLSTPPLFPLPLLLSLSFFRSPFLLSILLNNNFRRYTTCTV